MASYDEDILNGKVQQYPWQVQIPDDFAIEPKEGETLEYDVVAANDSGKSKMIVAPCALWSVCQFDKSETVITSASGSQLDRQTARYVKDYARRMNATHGEDLWDIQYRKLTFKPTDGIIDLFATDEAGMAEGWHKRDFDSAFSIIVDEAKSVNDEVFTALDRCHDAQRILRVSSPAIGTTGYFYKAVISGRSKVYKITAYDCPHISKSKIDKIIQTYGFHSPITRSIIFAEFTTVDSSVVIHKEWLNKLARLKPLENTKDQPLRVGCDMAAGGDENVITIWKGNKQLELRPWRDVDTVRTKEHIVTFLNHWGVAKDSEYLFFDDGNVGHSIIDMLRREGWNITRVLNQGSPVMKDQYMNRGAELWFNLATFIHPNEELIFLDDPVLMDQLSNRYFKQGEKGKIKLESKKEAKANGHPSPDRADATVLAFTGMKAPFYSIIGSGDNKQVGTKSASQMTAAEIIEMMDSLKWKDFESQVASTSNNKMKEINCSMNALLSLEQASRDEGFSEIDQQLRYARELNPNK